MGFGAFKKDPNILRDDPYYGDSQKGVPISGNPHLLLRNLI